MGSSDSKDDTESKNIKPLKDSFPKKDHAKGWFDGIWGSSDSINDTISKQTKPLKDSFPKKDHAKGWFDGIWGSSDSINDTISKKTKPLKDSFPKKDDAKGQFDGILGSFDSLDVTVSKNIDPQKDSFPKKDETDDIKGWFDGILGCSDSKDDTVSKNMKPQKDSCPKKDEKGDSRGWFDGIFGASSKSLEENEPGILKDSKEEAKDLESSAKNCLSKGDENEEANRGWLFGLFGGSTKEPMGDFRNELDSSSKDKETDKKETGRFPQFFSDSEKPEETKIEKHDEARDSGWLSGFLGDKSEKEFSGWVGILSYEGIEST